MSRYNCINNNRNLCNVNNRLARRTVHLSSDIINVDSLNTLLHHFFFITRTEYFYVLLLKKTRVSESRRDVTKRIMTQNMAYRVKTFYSH